MKKKEQMKTWRGLAMVALALGVSLTACETEKPNCPARGEQSQTQEEPGVEVLIEFVDSKTGETTRAKTGDSNYSFTPLGEGGQVQMQGVGRRQPESDGKTVNAPIEFYAEQNIIFKGWSWRYVDDPKGTHRDKDGNKVSDYVRDVALQTEAGVQPLNNGVSGFTCKYRPGSDHNQAYVKVEYEKVPSRNIIRLRNRPDFFFSGDLASDYISIISSLHSSVQGSFVQQPLERAEKLNKLDFSIVQFNNRDSKSGGLLKDLYNYTVKSEELTSKVLNSDIHEVEFRLKSTPERDRERIEERLKDKYRDVDTFFHKLREHLSAQHNKLSLSIKEMKEALVANPRATLYFVY